MLKYDANGLIPAVVQDAATRQVLMVGYMNQEALRRTVATGQAWFWSRSRSELWHKGATSGHYLNVRGVRVDCDGDTVLVEADPAGPTCHTGAVSCFFGELAREDVPGAQGVGARGEGPEQGLGGSGQAEQGAGARGQGPDQGGGARGQGPEQGAAGRGDGAGEQLAADAQRSIPDRPSPPDSRAVVLDGRTVEALFAVIAERQRLRPEGSYVAKLLDAGVDRIAKKIGEEATEVVIAAKNGDRGEITWEVADLWFHSLVLLAASGLTPADVWEELDRRRR